MIGLVFILAILSAVPGLNVFVLGYLLEVEGRVARGLPLREAFPRVWPTTRVALALFAFLSALVALRFLAGLSADARLIDPSFTANGPLLAAKVALLAGLSAGALWLARHADRLQAASAAVGPGRLLRLGLFGLFSTIVWLALPAALLLLARSTDHAPRFFALVGALLLLPILARLPILQAQLAADGDLRRAFDWSSAASIWRRAPLTISFGLASSYALSAPLFVLSAIALPKDAAWLIGLVFVPLAILSRLIVAFAYRRAAKLERDAPRPLRWLAGAILFAVVSVYALAMFLAPGLAATGSLTTLLPPVFTLPF